MPVWAMALQLGIAALQALVPTIQAAIKMAEALGHDTSGHQNALNVVNDTVKKFNMVIASAGSTTVHG
jgi:hypothetical protein